MTESIEVRYKEIFYNGSAVYHKYIVYTDSNGNEWYARGGPAVGHAATITGQGGNSFLEPFGNIITDYGQNNAISNPDFDSENDDPRETIVTADDLSVEFLAIINAMDDIEAENHTYNPTGPAGRNSNSAVDTALSRVNTTNYPDGLPLPTQDDRGEYLAPASGYILPNEIQPDPIERIRAVADRLYNEAGDIIDLARGRVSPLVLDLDHSGTIELISLANSETYWDGNVDGFANVSGWVTGGDGFLALDVNENGRIDDNSELFGTVDTDGFTILAQYDTNLDGIISAGDEVWDDLIIWIDSNENGYSEETELYILADHDIISIDLGATEVSQTNQGHAVTHISTFTVDTGSGTANYAVHDVWFQYDKMNSIYAAELELQEAVFYMPTMRGYGDLPDLHIAMSLDCAGTDNLLTQVFSVFVKTPENLFSETTALAEDVRNILFRWAGVDGLDGTERGSNVDSRELSFLEKMTAQDFLQRDAYSNPLTHAGRDLSQAFSIVFNHYYARLVAQSAGGELFEGDWYYNIASDSFEGVTGLDADVLDALETEATGLANTGEREVFWQNVVRMVEYSVGTDNLPSGDQTALNAAIYASDNTLDLNDILGGLLWSSPAGLIYNGTTGDDSYSGGVGDDDIDGANGNDTLYGGAGVDTINGGNGNDVITGGTDGDYVLGEAGNDTYIYGLGDGSDTFRESGSDTGDKIVFGVGIDSGDLTIYRAMNGDDLVIEIDTGTQTGLIVIENQFATSSGAGAIETLEFYDTSTLDLTALPYTLSGSDAAETLTGVATAGLSTDTIYGNGGNDKIYGYLGADILYGGTGDDTIYGGGADISYASETATNTLYGDAGNDKLNGSYGIDHLHGGAGNDTLQGNRGDDEYYFDLNDGHDNITEVDASGYGTDDTINLGEGIEEEDVTIIREGSYDLKILIDGGQGGTITLINQFATFLGSGAVETIKFHDTTVWDLTTMSFGLVATDAAETLNGNNSGVGSPDDIIYAQGGNDTIYGYLGSDQLHGGDGDDTIHAGSASLSYYNKTTTNYLYGDAGNDTIWGSYGGDHIYGGTGNDTLRGRLGNDHYYFERAHGDDTIEDQGAVSGSTNIDTLHLGETIDAGDLSYERVGNTDLKILINGGSGGSILLVDQFETGSPAKAIEYIQFSDNTTIDLRTLSYTLIGSAAGETLIGTPVNSSTEDTIYGAGGNDTISGYLGSDTLFGGDGNDTIHGGGSGSTYYGETSTNYLYGEAGDDDLWGSNGIDHLTGGIGNDTFHGRSGADQYYFSYGDGNDEITETGEDVETLNFDSSIEAADITYVRVGDYDLKVVIDGGFGGSILLENQFGTSSGSAAVELIRLSDDTEIDLRTLGYTLMGTSAGETLVGTRTNSNGADMIYGGGGNDTISGYLGSDTLFGGDGNDTIYGGGSGSTYYGETDTNYLYGQAGDDVMQGSNGSDFLYGGDGSDSLRGRNGADTFIFLNGETGIDTIVDFTTGQGDAIDISDLLSLYDPLNDAITDFVEFTTSGSNTIVKVDMDGTGGTYSLTQIATLSGVTGLTDEAALVTNGNLIVV
ncbi:MAG: calcium-binding protein [Micavibrio sp.]